ncbi:hypothetical protein N7510_003452 [Penicillium lagena]|nr:hypothetical protein N7510_003452 [Penicillium lagena]
MEKTPIWIKLADFGISKLTQEDETELRTRIGTEGYMAPEVFGLLDDSTESSSYTNAVDIWSLGCLLYYALTKRTPFSTFLSLQAYVKSDAAFPEKPLYEKGVSPSGRAFIQRLLRPSPEERPKASKQLLATWIIDINAIPDPRSALDPEDPVGRPLPPPPSHKNSSSESRRGPTPSPFIPSGPEMNYFSYELWNLIDKTKSLTDTLESSAPTNDEVSEAWKSATEYIVKKKAKAHAEQLKNLGGHTPLSYAIMSRLEKIATLLLENGSRSDTVDYKGRTPLHLAVASDKVSTELVRRLIEAGASVNQEDMQKCSPLFVAAGNKVRGEVIGLLLDCGADCEFEDAAVMRRIRHAKAWRKFNGKHFKFGWRLRVHTTTGCGEQGFPSAQPYLSHTPKYSTDSLNMDRQRRRSFKIKSSFGEARKWRSRKNRPCDTCRRRKTACVIETEPPCRFCRTRGLQCTSTEDRRTRQSRLSRVPLEDQSVTPDTPAACDEDDSLLESNSESGSFNIFPGGPPNASPGTAGALPPPEIQPASYTQSPAGVSVTTNPQIHTLEDNENRTAHYMGLSGEQDTDLLASFRSVIINEQDGVSADVFQVYPGDPVKNMPPIHFNILHDEFQPSDNVAKARASETIESMVSPHASALVRLFFKHVHPVYCVISKLRFLQEFATDKLRIPASLRGAVYGLGAMFWHDDPDLQRNLPFDLHDLFEEAHSSLQREFHAPNLWKLQACLLLLYERPADNATIETPRTWVFSAHIVACAQMIGLHQDPKLWQIAPWEIKLRNKLWWATYMADLWSSVCHGNPPHIYPNSFTTSLLDMEDLAFDEDVPEQFHNLVDASSRTVEISTCARFLQMVKLSQILHELIDLYHSDLGYEKGVTNRLDRETKLLQIKSQLETYSCMRPHCVTMGYCLDGPAFRNNAPLCLAFFAVQGLLFRALMSPAKMAAKSDPNSPLGRHFDQAVTQFGEFTVFMHEITLPCLHAFWGGHARSQLTLCGNFLIYLFLLAPSPEQVRSAFRLLESFHESLQRLREWANDDASLGLLRPVALRMDSFFTQAAQIMRTGMELRTQSSAS